MTDTADHVPLALLGDAYNPESDLPASSYLSASQLSGFNVSFMNVFPRARV